ncbi:MAG: hypothetical protein GKS06_03735 [Acidobacteria bacterium]|nr:hypothetical protein [Acidobacteriota bacterium]
MTPGQDHEPPTESSVALADPVDSQARSAGAAGDQCPSCDTPGAWKLSSRHRFNPFGGVTLLVLSFWAAFANLFLDLTWLPALGLAAMGVAVMVWKRTAMVCQVCGMVEKRS